MKNLRKKYVIAGIAASIIFIVLFSLSAIIRNWLIKNSESLIGRKIAIEELHFNYLKIAVDTKNVVIYETNKTDSFISFKELYIDFSPWKLLNGEYSLSKVYLDQFRIKVIQNGEHFNFDDLTAGQDSLNPEKADTDKKAKKFSIYNIQLKEGNMEYTDVSKNSSMDLKNLELDLPSIAWNNKQSDVGANFNIGEHGKVVISAVVDNEKENYQINVKTSDVPLAPVTNYLKDHMDISSLEGDLTSDLKITGDLQEVINVSVSGPCKIKDLEITDGHYEKILSVPEVTGRISDINLKTFHFGFSGIEVNQPKLAMTRDKDMTNIERFFLPYLRADSIVTQADTSDTETSYYIDTLKINNGEILITDNTLNRRFKYSVAGLNMTMNGLSENAEQIPVSFNARLNQGKIEGKTKFSINNPLNFELKGKVINLDLVSFSPYTEYYLASPLTQGWFNYDLSIKMTATSLQNENHLRVNELEFGKKQKNTKPVVKAPVRLALYIMKDINDMISIDLPVNGNPSDPKFKLGKLIWKTFGNLMVKTAASPFRAMSGLVGTNPESLQSIPFSYLQDSLDAAQKQKLDILAKILKKKPKLVVEMVQHTDEDFEKEEIAYLLAKNEYSNANPDEVAMSEPIDSGFVAYISSRVPDFDQNKIKKACRELVSKDKIDSYFENILGKRNQLIHDYMVGFQGLPESSVKISTADLENLPEELRKPEFKLEVSLNM